MILTIDQLGWPQGKTMQPSDVIQAFKTYGEPELVQVLNGLCGCGMLLDAPLSALTELALFVAKSIEARSEKEQMKENVKAIDAAVDAAEEAALKS